jgi:hypothetical protein
VGSPEFYELPAEEQLAVAERAVGIYRDSDLVAGAVPTTPPRPYGGAENNPLDNWN